MDFPWHKPSISIHLWGNPHILSYPASLSWSLLGIPWAGHKRSSSVLVPTAIWRRTKRLGSSPWRAWCKRILFILCLLFGFRHLWSFWDHFGTKNCFWNLPWEIFREDDIRSAQAALRDQQLVKFEAKKPTALKPYLSEQARHAKSRGFLILWRLAKKKAIERLETWNLYEFVEKTMRNRISHPGNTFLSFWGYCNWFMISQYCGQYLNFKLFGHVCQLSSTFIKPVT